MRGLKINIKNILPQLKSYPTKSHLYYWILPLVVMTILFLMYFSGIPSLTHIVSPDINPEFGALENIQLLTLLIMLVISIRAAILKNSTLLKVGFAFLALFTVFIFLEEIDYGAHYRRYFYGDDHTFIKDLTGGHKNIHNQPGNAKLFKRIVKGMMAMLFLFLPFLKGRVNHFLINYLTPKLLIITTVMVFVLVDLTPRVLVGSGVFEVGRLGINIFEFSEVMIYYVFMLYTWELVFEKELDVTKKPVQSGQPLAG